MNTLLTTSATYGTGKVVLGGGALVTTSNEGVFGGSVPLRSSYPSGTTTWTAIAVVVAAVPVGGSVTVTPYALCSL